MSYHCWQQAAAGEPTDFAEPPPDGPYCVLCDEPETAAAPLVATRWGPMHAACAASEPADEDGPPDADHEQRFEPADDEDTVLDPCRDDL